MKRGVLVLLAIAGLATAAAAAFTSGLAHRDTPRPARLSEAPSQWSDKDRTFIGEAQLLQARAQGDLDRDVKSILNVNKRMEYGDFVWNDRNVPKGPVWVRVDLDRQLISVFRDGHEIGTAVILYGADEKETPVTMDQLPAPVKATLMKEAGNGKVEEIDKETENGRTIYEADVMLDGKKWEIKIDQDGQLIRKALDEEKDGEDEHHEHEKK